MSCLVHAFTLTKIIILSLVHNNQIQTELRQHLTYGLNQTNQVKSMHVTRSGTVKNESLALYIMLLTFLFQRFLAGITEIYINMCRQCNKKHESSHTVAMKLPVLTPKGMQFLLRDRFLDAYVTLNMIQNALIVFIYLKFNVLYNFVISSSQLHYLFSNYFDLLFILRPLSS